MLFSGWRVYSGIQIQVIMLHANEIILPYFRIFVPDLHVQSEWNGTISAPSPACFCSDPVLYSIMLSVYHLDTYGLS